MLNSLKIRVMPEEPAPQIIDEFHDDVSQTTALIFADLQLQQLSRVAARQK